MMFLRFLCVILVTVAIRESDAQSVSHTDRLKRFIPTLPATARTFLKNIYSDFENLLISTSQCIEGQIKGLSCNLNATIDPFFLLDQCTKNTRFNELVQKVVDLMPATSASYSIPPVISKDRCFQFNGFFKDLPTIGQLIPRIGIDKTGINIS